MAVLEALNLAYFFDFCLLSEKAIVKLLGSRRSLDVVWSSLTDFRIACFIGDVFWRACWPTLRLAETNW